ncbi:hypothetical protein [Paucisalibacillus globulus]|uniref:hypothetical protein n=1 Tax=Paucisalibacillus globulus TaxID=351095 RepID=UPI000BB96EA1|nr:hypothetical protein [Paucisalibacillus globulus]
MEKEKEEFQPYFDGNRIVYPGATRSEQEAFEYLDRRDPLLKRYFENGSVSNGKTNQNVHRHTYGHNSF